MFVVIWLVLTSESLQNKLARTGEERGDHEYHNLLNPESYSFATGNGECLIVSKKAKKKKGR